MEAYQRNLLSVVIPAKLIGIERNIYIYNVYILRGLNLIVLFIIHQLTRNKNVMN